MVKKHLKRLAMPKTWPLPRKISKRVARPLPGAHAFEHALPLILIIRDMLRHAETGRDVKNILKTKEILVEGKKARNARQLVGLMDVLEIPETGELFRIIINKKGKLALIKSKKEDAKLKLCKITGKKMHKGSVQLALHDGRTLLTEDRSYKTGDALLLKVPEQEIMERIKMEKSAMVYLTGGSHIGQTGHVEEIIKDKILLKTKDGKFETLRKFAFPIGKEKARISLEQ